MELTVSLLGIAVAPNASLPWWRAPIAEARMSMDRWLDAMIRWAQDDDSELLLVGRARAFGYGHEDLLSLSAVRPASESRSAVAGE